VLRRAALLAGLLGGLAVQGCAHTMADAQKTRPQLSDEQARGFERAAVLGDWNPLAEDDAAIAPRFIVDQHGADGRTRFAGLQAAVSHAHAEAAAGSGRIVIGIAPGSYDEVVHLPAGAVPLTLRGLGVRPAEVRLRFALHAGASGSGFTQRVAQPMASAGPLPAEASARLARCGARERIGTLCTAVLTIERDGTHLQNLSIENTHIEGPSDADQQAVALAVEGADRVHLDRVRLLGHQDTLYLATSTATAPARVFIDRSLVAGDVDFIFGNATAFIQRSEIRFNGADRGRSAGFIAAPSTDARTPHGFVFDDCDFTTVPGPAPQRVHLARQWFPGAACSPYGQAAAACRIAPADAAAGPGELKPSALAAVGQMVVMRSRLGPHIAPDEPWAPWQRDRAHRAYRPAQHDSDQAWRLLATAGHDPAAFGFTRPQPPRPWLAEHRNRLCVDAGETCAADPNHHGGLE
jgi:pectin methylesterase-like acyl-CoA thioesterase